MWFGKTRGAEEAQRRVEQNTILLVCRFCKHSGSLEIEWIGCATYKFNNDRGIYKRGKDCLSEIIYDLHNRKNSNINFYKDLELPVE